MSVRLFLVVSAFLLFVPACLRAQVTVEIRDVKLVRSLTVVVHDPADSPIDGVLVEEVGSDWEKTLRSTKTDLTARFTFDQVKGRDVYYLQLGMNGFNPLRVRVKVDRIRGTNLRLKMVIAT